MRTAEALRSIIDYGQIAQNGTKPMIPDTEGHSISYSFFYLLSLAGEIESSNNQSKTFNCHINFVYLLFLLMTLAQLYFSANLRII